MTTHCAVDFHARSQTIRWVSSDDGEIHARTLDHTRDDVRRFYAELPRPVIVGFEAHGYTAWFEALLSELDITVWIGDPAQIRAKKTRKQKNDDRDADHILKLMLEGTFPLIDVPSPESRSVRQLLRFRHNLVRERTRIANSLSAIALSCGAGQKPKVLTQAGRAQLLKLSMSAQLAWQRDCWLARLDSLAPILREAERRLEEAAARDARVARLRTQPGIGLLTALALVHVIGRADRFETSRKVTAYVGLDPVEDSSGGRRRIGRISKQGSRLLRYLLLEAASVAARLDPELKSVYTRIKRRKTHAEAKVAVARRLLVRSWIMLRDGIDYEEFCRRGRRGRGVESGEPDEPPRL